MKRTTHAAGLLAVAGALISIAGAECAPAGGCSWSLGSVQNGFMPDLDQKRQPGPLFFDGMSWVNIPAGLPGNGANYCSPTSHTNTMAYLANHGFPSLMPGGAANWQAANKYETATAAIVEMGVRMETDPDAGTLCCGHSGFVEYLDVHAPGKFTVSSYAVDKLSTVTIGDLAFCALAGGYVNLMIGWYLDLGTNYYEKAGGHVVTMVKLEGWCGGDREVGIRDPGNGNSSLLAQSMFATNKYDLLPVNGFFNDDPDAGIDVYYQRTQERMLGYNTSDGRLGMIRGYRVVVPKYGVTLTPPPMNNILVHAPIQPTHPTGPTVLNLPLAIGGPATSFAIDPTQLAIYYAGRTASGAPDPRVHRLDRVTGESTPIYTGVAPSAVECGRFRQVFIVDGLSLVFIDNTQSPPTVMMQSLTAPIAAMAYDDVADSLICLSVPAAGQPHVKVFDGRSGQGFQQPPLTYALPSAVALAGETDMAISPDDGSLWIHSRMGSGVFKVVLDRAAGAVLAETVSDPSFVDTIGIDVHTTQTREHILLARQVGVAAAATGIIDWEKDSTGGWGPAAASDFAGLPAHGGVKLSRSRTNFDPTFQTGPAYHDVLPANGAPPAFDCPGDLDGDGVVGAADMALLLGSWGSAGEGDASDIDGNGVVNSGDLALLLGAWGPCT